MLLDTDHIVVIGFPHNQKSGGLGPETTRSMDGLYRLYSEHVQARKLSMVYVSGTSRATMKAKKFSTELLLNDAMEMDNIIHSYKGCSIPADIARRNVGVILLIHGTGGFPKIFAAQVSTTYIQRDNSYNGRVIAKLLKDMKLSNCIEKLQLVMCGGAKYMEDQPSLVQGLCDGVIEEDFGRPPMVIGWDCEVTHNDSGALVVGGAIGNNIDSSHRHVMNYNGYIPSAMDTYQKPIPINDSFFSSPSGYVKARSKSWLDRPVVKTTGRCVIL